MKITPQHKVMGAIVLFVGAVCLAVWGMVALGNMPDPTAGKHNYDVYVFAEGSDQPLRTYEASRVYQYQSGWVLTTVDGREIKVTGTVVSEQVKK